MKPITFYAYLLAVSAVGIHLASFFPAMPFNMAVHFGPGGAPDLWMAREAYFGLGFAMILLNVAVFGLAPWFAQMLGFRKLSVPGRAYWMSSDRIDRFYFFLRGGLAWFGTANLFFFGFVNQLVFDANMANEAFAEDRFLLGLAAYFLFVIIWLVTIFRWLGKKK